MVMLEWQGFSQTDIAKRMGRTPANVSLTLCSPEADEIRSQLMNQTLSTMPEIKVAAQLIAPQIFQEKVNLALGSADEKIRNSACSDLLGIAGHSPTKHVEVTHIPEDKYKGLSEVELRQKIQEELAELTSTPVSTQLH